MQSVPCRGVLFAGLLVSKRERALSCGRLLDVGQRPKRSVHALPRGNVQHYRGIHVCCIVPCVPCWSVLPRWMQRVERERLVSCWQLFCFGKWYQQCLFFLSCWSILFEGMLFFCRKWILRDW